MADDRTGAARTKHGTVVKITGVLAETPVLKQRPGRADFCEVMVRTNDCSLPVRFLDQEAREITGWTKGCEVTLVGSLRRFEWENKARQPRERMVVFCTRIESFNTPQAETRIGRDLT